MSILASIEIFGFKTTGTHRTVEHNSDLYLVYHTAEDGSQFGLKLNRDQIVDFPAGYQLAVPIYKEVLFLKDVVAIPS